MALALCAVLFGLMLLVWSADRFVEGASATANLFGMPPLLIGMIIVGFGTSAPEIVVSAIASAQGNPGLALGNAYGSNISNIALILGTTAVIGTLTVHSQVLRRELPILTVVTLLSAAVLWDLKLSRLDSILLLAMFMLIMAWTVFQGLRQHGDALESEFEQQLEAQRLSTAQAVFALLIGLVLLIVSSRIVVWGAVVVATEFGVSDLIIGLTVVALGTSLPELASSLAAVRKGEDDIALGNILGSNLFNTLAVVGLAGVIQPIVVSAEVLHRDVLVMSALTLSLFVLSFGFRRPGRINRLEGALLLASYVAYNSYLVWSVIAAGPQT